MSKHGANQNDVFEILLANSVAEAEEQREQARQRAIEQQRERRLQEAFQLLNVGPRAFHRETGEYPEWDNYPYHTPIPANYWRWFAERLLRVAAQIKADGWESDLEELEAGERAGIIALGLLRQALTQEVFEAMWEIFLFRQGKESCMSRHTVEESAVREWVLDREDRACPECGERMHVRCRRSRSILTLDGPTRLSLGLVQCRDGRCQHMKLYGPEQESSVAMPRWGIGWDVFCWIGQRRFSRHWSVSQIRNELSDSYDLKLSDDAIEDHIAAYQTMVAARHQDSQQLAALYGDTKDIVLTIDGLQPEKGHETLYVVREVTRSRVWFAQPLLSGATDEIRKLILRAKEIAAGLGLNVVLWISDKQDAFVKCIADEFPDVPHRFCVNHFVRDLAKPIQALDSTAKKKMRSKIRGLRALECEVLKAQQAHESASNEEVDALEKTPDISSLAGDGGAVVLDFCSAVRGILNDNHGGPCDPSGIRMVDALADVQESLERIAASGKSGPAFSLLGRLKGFIDRGVAEHQETFSRVRSYTNHVRDVVEILSVTEGGTLAGREPLFAAKLAEFQSAADDPVYLAMAKVMSSFQAGLFAGTDLSGYPHDNLDLADSNVF